MSRTTSSGPRSRARTPGARAGALNRATVAAGGYGGDFASVLACRAPAQRGRRRLLDGRHGGIPLTLLARGVSSGRRSSTSRSGCPSGSAQLRGAAVRSRLYRERVPPPHTIVAYGAGEVDALRDWLGERRPAGRLRAVRRRHRLLPSGAHAARRRRRRLGRRRSASRLRALARGRAIAARSGPSASSRRASMLARSRLAPPNVRVDTDIPLAAVRIDSPRRASSRCPSATTGTRARPRSSSRRWRAASPSSSRAPRRSRTGYELEDGVNCVLVPPGDAAALEQCGRRRCSTDAERAASIGARARETVEQHLTWRRYTDAIRDLLLAAGARSTVRA